MSVRTTTPKPTPSRCRNTFQRVSAFFFARGVCGISANSGLAGISAAGCPALFAEIYMHKGHALSRTPTDTVGT